MDATAFVWRSENSLGKSVTSFYCVGPRDWTQVISALIHRATSLTLNGCFLKISKARLNVQMKLRHMGVICNMQTQNIEDPGVLSKTDGDKIKDAGITLRRKQLEGKTQETSLETSGGVNVKCLKILSSGRIKMVHQVTAPANSTGHLSSVPGIPQGGRREWSLTSGPLTSTNPLCGTVFWLACGHTHIHRSK